jgi:hypothetical protein
VPAKEDIDAKKAYRYRIDISDDNKTWRDYADRSAMDSVGAEYVDERAERARYVRLTLTARKGGTENLDRPKVAELMVIGKPVAKR